jgi:hypothetical protein
MYSGEGWGEPWARQTPIVFVLVEGGGGVGTANTQRLPLRRGGGGGPKNSTKLKK